MRWFEADVSRLPIGPVFKGQNCKEILTDVSRPIGLILKGQDVKKVLTDVSRLPIGPTFKGQDVQEILNLESLAARCHKAQELGTPEYLKSHTHTCVTALGQLPERRTRWFKYDRDKLWLVYTQSVPVIFEPPCTFNLALHLRYTLLIKQVRLCDKQRPI